MKRTIFVWLLGLFSQFSAAAADVPTISLDEVYKSQVAGSSSIGMVIDVRTPEEFASGHVPGAVNMPVGELQSYISDIQGEDQQLVVYCRSGKRARKAIGMLNAAGLNNTKHMQGDISAWIAEGYPTQK